MEIRKYGKNWAVYDDDGILVCVTVYKKGAIEVARRLESSQAAKEVTTHELPAVDQRTPAHP